MARTKEDVIRYRGRRHPVIDRLTAGKKTFLILERLGSRQRPVYRAFDRQASLTGEIRCLHVLPKSRSTVEHLKILSRLSATQTNLPTILESTRRREDIVVVTRWIEGPNLRNYLKHARSGREPWPSVLICVNAFRKLAHACYLLHRELGVVHGDIKPDNLILCRNRRQIIPIDYGSAWCVERTTARTTADGLTRGYAAPELNAQSLAPDFRSDQFSASVVLYELLTGKLPFDGLGGRLGQPQYQSTGVRLTPPSRALRHTGYLPKGVLADLDELLRRGLALTPGNRYGSGREWLDAIDALQRKLNRRIEIEGANRWLFTQLDRLRTFARITRNKDLP